MSGMSELFGIMNAAAGEHAAGALQFVLGEVESWDPDQGTVVVTTKPGVRLVMVENMHHASHLKQF